MVTKARFQLLMLGIKQKQIAAEYGCSESYVNRVVHGKQKPSKELINVIMRMTGLPFEALFEVKTNE